MVKHDKRVALVTGANRGIGYAIAKGLAERGITTVLAARDPDKGAAGYCTHAAWISLANTNSMDIIV